MAPQLVFNQYGESLTFTIGEDVIYFHEDDRTGQGIVVAHAATGEPWSRTTEYIRFATEDEAQRFLDAALAQGQLPHGWQ